MGTTKNYKPDGDTIIIGGTVRFVEGAVIEGLPLVLPSTGEPISGLKESTAKTIAELKEDYNNLFLALRNNGIIA
jgi:hypothetical protein